MDIKTNPQKHCDLSTSREIYKGCFKVKNSCSELVGYPLLY